MRTLFYVLLSVFICGSSVFAAAKPVDGPELAKAETKTPTTPVKTGPETAVPDFRETLFTLETDEESASESLDRISGHIDRGYAAPEQTYQSENHKLSGGAYQQSEGKSKEYGSA